MSREWFRRFKDGDFDVDDRPREGRPKTFEDADVIYYELLKPNETITGERYRTQLMRLSRALLKWEVLLHPPYSPDIAPSDYYLFRSMAHGLDD